MTNFSSFEMDPAGAISVLSIFPNREDQISLSNIFRSGMWPLCPGSKWELIDCTTLDQARPSLRAGGISIVLCDRDLRPGSWKDLVEALERLPDPPYLIVTSRDADDCLWAEALNLGAFDVLPTPFDSAEAIRILSVAWLRWMSRHMPIRPGLTKAVA